VASLLFVIGTELRAQEIAGSWQTTLPPVASMPSQRIVVKVAKKADGSLKGTLIFIDRGADGPPLVSISYATPDFSFEIGGLNYHGKMGADGNSIAGVLVMPTGPESKQEIPLTLARATPDTAWTYSGPAPLTPMAASADPSFEVTTIRPTKPGTGNGHAQFVLGRRKFEATNCTATELIKIAYFIRGRQVLEGPKWINEQQWDVTAQTDADIPGQPSEAQTRVMVRKMLEQRFGLKVRQEKREFTVYAMVVDKPSANLSKSDAQEKPMMIAGKMGEDGQQTLQFADATMKEFAALMMNFIQTHQIVDETGLEGKYDFTIVTPRSAFAASPGTEDLPDPAFVQAIKPLGLKFALKKEPLDVVIVEQLTQPTEN
jgi:uncharacterized protein (TIGR03435 family)